MSTFFLQNSAASDPIRLNMAEDSVDDMYSGCEKEVGKTVRDTFLPNEKNTDSDFKNAWEEAEKRNKKKLHNKNILTKEEASAIYVYTLDKPKVYLNFNIAVRSQRNDYTTEFNFKYHALHFYLTRAVQKLNKIQNQCPTVYRRDKSAFSKDVKNQLIQFGSFTSSSLGSYPNPEKFGSKSCFEIRTCFGADISLHSKVEGEREVLIPPYEVFNVTDIVETSPGNHPPCDVVYKLRSTGTLSNTNCTEKKK